MGGRSLVPRSALGNAGEMQLDDSLLQRDPAVLYVIYERTAAGGVAHDFDFAQGAVIAGWHHANLATRIDFEQRELVGSPKNVAGREERRKKRFILVQRQVRRNGAARPP